MIWNKNEKKNEIGMIGQDKNGNYVENIVEKIDKNVESKSKSNNSNNNISPNKVKKTKNKLFSMYNTHTNIRTKQKPKIKHSPRNLQLKAKMKREKSNHKYSILLEDFMKKKKIKALNKPSLNYSHNNRIENKNCLFVGDIRIIKTIKMPKEKT